MNSDCSFGRLTPARLKTKSAGAVALQLPGRRVDVVPMTSRGRSAWYLARRSLPSPYVLQRAAEVPADEAPGAGDEDAHPLHRLVLAALECQLHVLGGLDLGDGALHVEPLGVVGGVGLVGLGLHLAVDDELVVVQVARVAGHAVVAAHVLGPQALLAGHEGLVASLAVAGADDLGAHAAEDLLHGLGEVADRGGGAFWMNRSPGLACSKANCTRSTASSRFMRKRVMLGSVTVRRLALADAVDEQRDDAAARAHDVAVAGAADGGAAGAVAGVGVDDGLHHGLGLAHGVDGVAGLVGGQAHDAVDALADGCVQDVVRSDDVGSHGLHGEELAGGHLLEGRRRGRCSPRRAWRRARSGRCGRRR